MRLHKQNFIALYFWKMWLYNGMKLMISLVLLLPATLPNE